MDSMQEEAKKQNDEKSEEVMTASNEPKTMAGYVKNDQKARSNERRFHHRIR